MTDIVSAFGGMVWIDVTIVGIVLGLLLLPHLFATLLWSTMLRPRLALPAALAGLLVAQALAVVMTDGFGWFAGVAGARRIALCVPLWGLLTLIVLNLMAAVLTRIAPPVTVDNEVVAPAPFWWSGPLTWVLRQAETLKNATYVPPTPPPQSRDASDQA